MAKTKKDENALKYLQMPLPSGNKYARMSKVAFGGLNKRYTIDSGEMSLESNISTNEYPYLTPSSKREEIWDIYKSPKIPISMAAFDDFIVVVYRDGNFIKLDYIYKNDTVCTGIIKELSEEDTSEDEIQRSIVQFNVYDTPTDPLTGQYVKKLLIFPDKVSMYMNIVESNQNPEEWKTQEDLAAKDLSVMYFYSYDGKNKRYYTVGLVKKTIDDDGYDENKVSYKRILQEKGGINYFRCDGMDALVKEYKNDTPEVDESGATIYPPPDTASHNCYYRNSYNNDIYKWCEYQTAKRLDEWGLNTNLNENGEIINETANKDGFILDGSNFIADGGNSYGWKVSMPPTVPNLKYATVHLSRVFGVDDDRVYASGYNDYTNWNLDTADEYNEANSWCSPSQSNSKADGKFTGITTFQSHVVCFKHDFMHEIYNTKNPFRLQDIYAEGAIDNRTIQDVDGKLIFVSEDDVKIYTGSNPRFIGYNLNVSKYTYAVSGTDNRNYYLYCEDSDRYKYLYVYDTYTSLWSEQHIEYRVLNFAHNKNGMYMFCENGSVYKMDTTNYNHNWFLETELITSKTVDIKHIKKLQMLAHIRNGAKIEVYILYDNEIFDSDTSHLVYSNGIRHGQIPIRVKPRKTANYGFKLHVEGYGYAKLYELEIFTEEGGDMYV